jgi:two-component system sensor histidine kinase VicK
MITGYEFIKKIGRITDDGIGVYDLGAGRFIYVNDNLAKIFNVETTSLVGNANILLKVIMGEDKDYLLSRYEELLLKGHINTTEFRLAPPDSDEPVKHLSCDVLMLDGSSHSVAVFVKDISKAKRHEDYLIKYTVQKDTLLDMLTHNLSGPLMLSRDIIEKLKVQYVQNDKESIQKLMSIMQENTQHCIDIVNDFLQEEHSESLQTYVRKTRFDIMEKISVTLEKLKEMNKNKKFVLASSLKNLNINSDPVKFFQVFHNILSNCLKYTYDDGTIEITVEADDANYTICINDNGIGIPKDIQEIIFKGKIPGRVGLNGEKSNGLGLSIAKKLVDVMGGKIWFQSQEGAGSSFCIQFPKE